MIQYLITALFDLCLAGLAFSKKDNPAAKALAFLLLALSVWLLELYLLTTIANAQLLDILFHVTRIGMFLIPFGFALLTWRLVGSRSKLFKLLFVIPGACISLSLWTLNSLWFPSELEATDGGYLPRTDTIYYIFIGYLVWCFAGSIWLVGSSYKAASSREKQRLKWLLITLLVSFTCGLTVLFFMPTGMGQYLSKFVGVITNVIFVSLLFYSTVQHNLMDIRLALSLGLTKAILLASFVWAYFVLTSVVGDHTQSLGGALTLLAFLVLMLEAYPRLLKWVLPNAKRILVKDGYDIDQVKAETEVDLKNSISFLMMFDVLDHLFLRSIKIKNYKLLMVEDNSASINADSIRLQGNSFELVSRESALVTYCASQTQLIMADEMPLPLHNEMKNRDASLCFPIFSETKIIAVMLVGNPINISYYRYDDLKIFEWLKSELGQVLNRLIRLNDMQEQLGEAKKTLSMLSLMNHYHHDIKVPFAIIDGVLSNDIYDRDRQRDIVLEQVERGSRLIATMASILGGKHKRRVQACSLESLVRDCLYLFEKSFDKVECDFENRLKVKGDAEDLKILFINLIKNAAEARRENSDLTLYLKSWATDDNVFLSVRDNGIGMTEQQLASLWEPGMSTKKFGNGIGMQAIKRIVDEHHAQINVTSAPEQGSEFVLRFHSTHIAYDDADKESTKDELAERRATYNVDKRNRQ